MHVRIGIGLCVLSMLEIFSGGCEPEVEGDNSHVVDTIRKQETDLFKKVAQKMDEAGECSYPL